MDDIDLPGGRDTLAAVVGEAELDGDKVNVVYRLTDINPPCLYVALSGPITPYNFGGDVRYDVFLVAPYTDEDTCIVQLQALLEAVLPLVSPADDITYVGLAVPEHEQPLPALRIPVEI